RLRCAPRPALFPYTTLFRSGAGERPARPPSAAGRPGAGSEQGGGLAVPAGGAEGAGEVPAHLEGQHPDLRVADRGQAVPVGVAQDRKSTRLNSSHVKISYAV